MNKILNRKMYRQKYLGVQKPQGFQTGGVAEAAELDISDEELEKELNIEKTEPEVEPEVESPAKTEDTGFASGIAKILSLEDTSGGLTRNQKLQSYLAPIAAALLTGDQRAGESKVSGTLRALGLGMAQLPGTIQAIAASDLEQRKVAAAEAKTAAEIQKAKNEAVGQGIQSLTSEQKQMVGLKTGLPAAGKVNAAGQVTEVTQKPSDKEEADFDKLSNNIDQIEAVQRLISSGEVSTGFFDNIFRGTAEFTGSVSQLTEVNQRLDILKKDYIASLRGAAVGPLEESSFDSIIPTASDDENVILTKLKVMKEGLETLRNFQMQNNGKKMNINDVGSFKNFNVGAKNFVIKDGVLTQVTE